MQATDEPGGSGNASQVSIRNVRLETPRLLLREHQESDVEGVLMYAADPEALKYCMAQPVTRVQVEKSLRRIEFQRAERPVRRRYELAVVRKEDDLLIGWIPLLLSGEADRNDAEVGWTLSRAYWGRGYATEATRAVLSLAFETLHLHRVWARCQSENVSSSHVMEKVGMRREGYFRRSRFVKGRWIDILQYSILDDEWWERKRASIG